VSKSSEVVLGKLKVLRKGLGLTQEKFAERLDLNYKYYQKLELGLRKDIRSSTIDRIAEAVGLESWELLHPKILPGPTASKYAVRREEKLRVAEEKEKRKRSGRKEGSAGKRKRSTGKKKGPGGKKKRPGGRKPPPDGAG
jgi:transcriptional regulator with XRE-family HTH domain